MTGALERFRLDGRVAIVTGASSGLGARFARVLAGAGASVVVAARRAERLEALAGELAGAGHRAMALRLDVADAEAIGPAELLNSERFLSLDLNYGRRVDSEMYEYLMDNGMTRDEYHFFLNHRLKHHCIMGNDYYVTNEHRVEADGTARPSGEVFGSTPSPRAGSRAR